MRYKIDSSASGEDSIEAFPDGPLSLNFANTVATHEEDSPYDYLPDFNGLLDWCRRAGAVSTAQVRELAAAAKRTPREADNVFASALELRRAIYRIASALARQRPAPRPSLHAFNAFLERAMTHAALVQRGNALSWDWRHDRADIDSILWPIVRDAARVFTSENIDRLVACEGERCSWLFMDTTKNRSKRFCRSAGCGNRTRVRRHYERLHS